MSDLQAIPGSMGRVNSFAPHTRDPNLQTLPILPEHLYRRRT